MNATPHKPHRLHYLGRPAVAAGRSPVVEGRLGAVAGGRRLAAAGGTPQVAEGILVVADILAAVGDRPLQAVASVFLGRAVPGRVGRRGALEREEKDSDIL